MTNQSLESLYHQVNLLRSEMPYLLHFLRELHQKVDEQTERLDQIIALIERVEYLENLHQEGIILCRGEDE